ncbi:MAG: nickel permease [bacterium]|nr:nickel permease [bacterium]
MDSGSSHHAFAIVAITVFALGLRHGADPDHLAAIDNMTRNSLRRHPGASRFIGTLFAGGHSLMVLAIALCVGLLGSRFASHSQLLETIGTWVSIVVLFALAALNLAALGRRRGADRPAGLRSALLPRRLRHAESAYAAIPVGLLFGLGFDTSSQVAAYALALAGGGVAAAVAIGAVFCLGMAATDTLDSLLVYRLCAQRGGEIAQVTRHWIVAVTVLALGVGLFELAQALGWQPPIPDLAVSAILVAALLAVFGWTLFSTSQGISRLRKNPRTVRLERHARACKEVAREHTGGCL